MEDIKEEAEHIVIAVTIITEVHSMIPSFTHTKEDIDNVDKRKESYGSHNTKKKCLFNSD